ncbi:MAG: hypothetical protein HY506_02475 [Candidatus Yanofskybacteria bacterium]|nr:hypothetical protein [Candidatus Yanofskybacteria bacterium]
MTGNAFKVFPVSYGMEQKSNIVGIFGGCYRLMYRMGAVMSDQFFAGLWSRESDGLLSDFIVFLKIRGEVLAQTGIARALAVQKESPVESESSPEESGRTRADDSKFFSQRKIAQRNFYVAQCRGKLIERATNILDLLEIIKHVGQTDIATPLLLERDLLKLQLAISNSSGARKVRQNSGSKIGDSTVSDAKPKSPAKIRLDEKHNDILDFIRSRGEQVRNTEIFARFPGVHRRTIKRKLSDLVFLKLISRTSHGKQVFYRIILEN